ncbi:basic proline-rich protein-like [Vulpes lagopus]|uniref:basic proline-rich protein-like n=1 Tax=Vulpes lagopus TaxID=494514 RepID=UPI001BC8E9E9|nr:basic proline-rich protein-like [Vulpes lagopus]
MGPRLPGQQCEEPQPLPSHRRPDPEVPQVDRSLCEAGGTCWTPSLRGPLAWALPGRAPGQAQPALGPASRGPSQARPRPLGREAAHLPQHCQHPRRAYLPLGAALVGLAAGPSELRRTSPRVTAAWHRPCRPARTPCPAGGAPGAPAGGGTLPGRELRLPASRSRFLRADPPGSGLPAQLSLPAPLESPLRPSLAPSRDRGRPEGRGGAASGSQLPFPLGRPERRRVAASPGCSASWHPGGRDPSWSQVPQTLRCSVLPQRWSPGVGLGELERGRAHFQASQDHSCAGDPEMHQCSGSPGPHASWPQQTSLAPLPSGFRSFLGSHTHAPANPGLLFPGAIAPQGGWPCRCLEPARTEQGLHERGPGPPIDPSPTVQLRVPGSPSPVQPAPPPRTQPPHAAPPPFSSAPGPAPCSPSRRPPPPTAPLPVQPHPRAAPPPVQPQPPCGPAPPCSPSLYPVQPHPRAAPPPCSPAPVAPAVPPVPGTLSRRQVGGNEPFAPWRLRGAGERRPEPGAGARVSGRWDLSAAPSAPRPEGGLGHHGDAAGRRPVPTGVRDTTLEEYAYRG